MTVALKRRSPPDGDFLTRRAPRNAKSSWDPETRTLALVVSSFADVRRGRYVERLTRDPAGWDLSRVNSPAGMPVLLSHDATSPESRIGRILEVSIGDGEVTARAVLSKSPHADAVVAEIEQGLKTAVSIGYAVARWERASPDDGAETEVWTAAEIRLLEVSVVSVAADAGAHVRSESAMPNQLAHAGTGPEELDDEDDEAEERRVGEIEALGRRVGTDERLIRRAVNRGINLGEFRALAIEDAHKKRNRNPTSPHAVAEHLSLDNPVSFRSAAAQAILDRIKGIRSDGVAGAVFADGEAAFGRRLLLMSGVDCRGWSDQRVTRAYSTTSDFTLIGGTVANTRVVEWYKSAEAPVNDVFGKRLVPDFNVHTEAGVDWSTLQIDRVNEHGEFKNSYVDETGERIQVFTVGGIVGLTRQVLINAHGALDKMAKIQGLRLAAYHAEQMVEFLEQGSFAGPLLADGLATFHNTRGNIETLATYNQQLTATELMRLRGKQARRKGKGNVIVGTMPRIWLVHPDFEAYAIQAMATVAASAVADVNPAAGRFTIVSEPRLTNPAKSWILADPAAADGAVEVLLDGQEEPHTEAQPGFEIDGVRFKIRHDFGLGWLEWRTWTRLDHNSVAP